MEWKADQGRNQRLEADVFVRITSNVARLGSVDATSERA